MNDSKRHISTQFDEELNDVRDASLRMAREVQQQLSDAIRAISTADHELADQVLSNDSKINEFEVDIDNACTQLIARRQPTARDLRQIMTTFRTIGDLERIGDESKKIARVAQKTFSSEQKHLLASLENFAETVLDMLRTVLQAFTELDADSALDVHYFDKKIDRQYEAMLRQLMTHMMEDPSSVPKIMDVVFSARALERIGDRCKNIAEYVIYKVHGQDVRHVSRSTMKAILRDTDA